METIVKGMEGVQQAAEIIRRGGLGEGTAIG